MNRKYLISAITAILAMSLHAMAVTPEMAVHLEGRQRKLNVYSALDSKRPLMGAHIYFTDALKKQINMLPDLFDFVAHDSYNAQDLASLDAAHMPWIQVYHNNIPMGT